MRYVTLDEIRECTQSGPNTHCATNTPPSADTRCFKCFPGSTRSNAAKGYAKNSDSVYWTVVRFNGEEGEEREVQLCCF